MACVVTLAGGLGASRLFLFHIDNGLCDDADRRPRGLAARDLSASNLLILFSPHPVSVGARLVMLLREGPQVLLALRFHFPCEVELTAHYGIALK